MFFYFFTQREGVIPRVGGICSYNFDDLEDQVMIFVFFDKLNQLVAVICLTTMEPFLWKCFCLRLAKVNSAVENEETC